MAAKTLGFILANIAKHYLSFIFVLAAGISGPIVYYFLDDYFHDVRSLLYAILFSIIFGISATLFTIMLQLDE
jgi:hypothetical protein